MEEYIIHARENAKIKYKRECLNILQVLSNSSLKYENYCIAEDFSSDYCTNKVRYFIN